jgi:hypothetical protein
LNPVLSKGPCVLVSRATLEISEHRIFFRRRCHRARACKVLYSVTTHSQLDFLGSQTS